MSARSLGAVAGLLTLAVLVPADSAAGVEVVKDGSFESTPPPDDNPNWEEFSLSFGTPICSTDSCEQGIGGGGLQTAGPRTGKNWVWFGGTFNPEEAFVSQQVTVSPGTSTLSFYLWIGNASGNGLDAFRVFMDDILLIEIPESASGYGTYTQVSLDVTAFGGTGAHDLSFEYEGFGGTITNMSLDDISLQSVQPVHKTVTLKGPKSVVQGKNAKLKATVQPCAGHEGDTIELFRGKKKIASAASDDSCKAKFKVKIKKTSTFRAVSPQQDADHLAGTSKKLKVEARKS